MKTVYYTASSVDGFIADADHSLSAAQPRHRPGGRWPTPASGRRSAAAVGANTHQWVLDHDPDGWDFTMPTWVFTHRDFPPQDGVTFTTQDVRTVHAAPAEAAGGKDVWLMGGGDLVGQFADAGLLDEVWVQYAPITPGGGAPLLPRRLELRLEEQDRNREFLVARYTVSPPG